MITRLAAAIGIPTRDREPAPAPPPPPASSVPGERRRRGSCAYHVDAWGDRLVGYDGSRRESWVERLDRPAEHRRVTRRMNGARPQGAVQVPPRLAQPAERAPTPPGSGTGG